MSPLSIWTIIILLRIKIYFTEKLYKNLICLCFIDNIVASDGSVRLQSHVGTRGGTQENSHTEKVILLKNVTLSFIALHSSIRKQRGLHTGTFTTNNVSRMNIAGIVVIFKRYIGRDLSLFLTYKGQRRVVFARS